MKGLSVVVTMLLFVVAVALSNYLKKTGVVPSDTHGSSIAASANGSVTMASYVRATRHYRN